jgi:transcriptional regulator with XRE-family HTH domain
MLTLGAYIKTLRKKQGITQEELANLIGVSDAFISRLERNHFGDIGSHTVIKIAQVLNVLPEELYFAAGYINEPKAKPSKKKPEEVLSELKLLIPMTIPIVDNIGKGESEAVDYAYWAKPKVGGRKVKGLLVRGFSMEPVICEGDVIFIDSGLSPRLGDIILYYNDNKVWLSKYTGDNYHLYGVIIEISKRLR